MEVLESRHPEANSALKTGPLVHFGVFYWTLPLKKKIKKKIKSNAFWNCL